MRNDNRPRRTPLSPFSTGGSNRAPRDPGDDRDHQRAPLMQDKVLDVLRDNPAAKRARHNGKKIDVHIFDGSFQVQINGRITYSSVGDREIARHYAAGLVTSLREKGISASLEYHDA